MIRPSFSSLDKRANDPNGLDFSSLFEPDYSRKRRELQKIAQNVGPCVKVLFLFAPKKQTCVEICYKSILLLKPLYWATRFHQLVGILRYL